jgi:Skp family chaperone for outer membrane proteins
MHFKGELIYSDSLTLGRSDVKIQSPILERLIAVLNCERLFGHYDAYADFMSEFNALQGENRILRERVRELKAAPAVSTTPQPILERKISVNGIDQAVQASDVNSTLTVDVATDPVFPDVDVDKPVLAKETLQKRPVAVQVTDSFDLGVRVEQYEEKLSDLEQQLKRVKCELQILTDKHQHEQTDWNRKTADWIDELGAKVRR